MRNKYTRKSKEEGRTAMFYYGLLDRFHTAMFTVDYDDPKIPDVDIFNMFNKAWIAFAEGWNKKAKRIAVDPKAFYNYAINQE